MKKLGRVQEECLAGLQEHGGWHPGCGWVWGSRSYTYRIMQSLVKREYAREQSGGYKVTIEGIQYLREIRPYLFR